MAQLSISDVRRELIRATGFGGAPSMMTPGTTVTGRIFHEVLAAMMGPSGWQSALEPDELGDSARLIAHTYEKLLGPRLSEARATLAEAGAETLVLWHGVQAMCRWLCRVLIAASQKRLIRYDSAARVWIGADQLCRPEFPLQWELYEPGWSAPVLVSGIADALWRDPVNGRWCVIEYKLGRGNPEADVAQACLYHAMIAASDLAPAADGSMALLAFHPELDERFFNAAELQGAQASLRALIGRLAGVLAGPGASRPVPDASDAPEEAAPARPDRVAAAANPAHTELGRQLVHALSGYGVSVQWNGETIAGPTFLRYPVTPARDVRKKAITERAGDLQMQLNLDTPPFIDMAGGRLVIDVQRPDRQTVAFSSVRAQIPPRQKLGNAKAPLGVDLDGRLQFVNLASPNNPHLLVAGTSGSGKSEWLRMACAGLMLANTPETLRLVLIDPKRNAFAELKNSPYLFGENGLVYPPEDRALDTLELLIEEMEARYRRFAAESAADVVECLAKTGEILPRIVCVCDEYADLISDRGAKRDVEGAINRLGAKARAAGIHLIIATQYPDRNTVGGALKMNLAGRVCLRTTNHVQSNMIINQSGAERLLGKGDLFFLSIGEPARLQAPYLEAEERAGIFARAVQAAGS
jgi:DNA segregation ATPase FtsK/SpoIIIE, S-DNA-T family